MSCTNSLTLGLFHVDPNGRKRKRSPPAPKGPGRWEQLDAVDLAEELCHPVQDTLPCMHAAVRQVFAQAQRAPRSHCVLPHGLPGRCGSSGAGLDATHAADAGSATRFPRASRIARRSIPTWRRHGPPVPAAPRPTSRSCRPMPPDEVSEQQNPLG